MAYNKSVRFEWAPNKDRANRQKHGLSFDQATELFTSDNDYLEIYDEAHSGEEDRFMAIGSIRAGVVVVVYTERQDDIIRIMSARRATRREVRLLRQYFGGTDAG